MKKPKERITWRTCGDLLGAWRWASRRRGTRPRPRFDGRATRGLAVLLFIAAAWWLAVERVR